ncbi:MAG: aldehyde dehydrogenase family protein, partial [Planctomycetaceae bacterium]|nr:aldehyde dehydrogenase family protein [Planctomycetaceae bacterium]
MADGDTQASTDPADLVRRAIARARSAQQAWAATPAHARAAAIRRIRDAIVDRADELAEIIARDTGKTRLDALATEVMPAANAVAWYSQQAPRWLKDRKIAHSHFI